MVQYSNNGGVTWGLVDTLYYLSYRSPRQFTYVLSSAMKTASTRFRVWQSYFTAASNDEWAIDDFYVATSDGIVSYFRDTFETSASSNWLKYPSGGAATYCAEKSLAFTQGATGYQSFAQTKPMSLQSGSVVQFKVRGYLLF